MPEKARKAKHLLVLKSISSFWPENGQKWKMEAYLPFETVSQNFVSIDLSHCCSEDLLIPIWLCSLIQLPYPGTNPTPGQLLLTSEVVCSCYLHVWWGLHSWTDGVTEDANTCKRNASFSFYFLIATFEVLTIQRYHWLFVIYYLDFYKLVFVLKIVCQLLYLIIIWKSLLVQYSTGYNVTQGWPEFIHIRHMNKFLKNFHY